MVNVKSTPVLARDQVVVPIRGQKAMRTPTVTLSRAQRLAQTLGADESPYALCPGNRLQLLAMCMTATETLNKSYNLKTCRRDVAAFRKWAAYCRSVGTTPWRDDTNANSRVDTVGHQREVVLTVNAMMHHQHTAVARPAGSNRTLIKPGSAMAWYLAVRRVFKVNLIPLLAMGAVKAALKDM